MTTNDAVQFFGSRRALWEFLSLKGGRATIQRWGSRPPIHRQYELEIKTNGYLRADDYGTRRIMNSPAIS